MLAEKLDKYKSDNCAVIALNEGGVIVGAQIAMRLHASMMMLLTEDVTIPGELDPVAALSSAGTFTYNGMYSAGQLEDFRGEYHQYIEQSRLEKFRKLNRLVGKDGEIHKEFLRHRVVILVADGLSSGFSLDIAADFLKPLKLKRLIIATPFASIPAVDRMHLFGDEVCCLDVKQNYMFTDHYYDENKIPDHDDAMSIIRNISLLWNRTQKT